MAKNLFEELGLNVSHMSAPAIEEQLNNIKDSLEKSYKDTLANIDKEIHEVAKDKYGEIDKINLKIAKENDIIEEYKHKISELEKEKNKHWNVRSEYYGSVSFIEKEISQMPEVKDFRNQKEMISNKFTGYMKLLERESKKIVSQNIKNDLINNLKTLKISDTHSGKND